MSRCAPQQADTCAPKCTRLQDQEHSSRHCLPFVAAALATLLHMRVILSLPDMLVLCLQLSLLHCIQNPSKALRQTVGTSIAVIVGLGSLKTWPELVPACVQGLEGSDINALEGSLDALFKVSTHDCT